MPPIEDNQGDDENRDDLDGTSTELKDGENEEGDSAADNKADGETSESDGNEVGDDEPDSGKSSKRTAAYIRDLKRRAREAERKAEAERAARLEAEKLSKAKPEPKREAFDTDEEYIDAMVDWKIQGNRKDEPNDGVDDLPDYGKTLVNAGMSVADSRYLSDEFEEAKKSHKDFEAKVMAANYITRDVMEGLVEADEPGKLLYWLASNQDELTRIANAGNTRAVAIALAKAEERMKLGTARDKKARTTSGAPDPIEPVDGGREESGDDRGENLTDEQWMRREKAKLLASRR